MYVQPEYPVCIPPAVEHDDRPPVTLTVCCSEKENGDCDCIGQVSEQPLERETYRISGKVAREQHREPKSGVDVFFFAGTFLAGHKPHKMHLLPSKRPRTSLNSLNTLFGWLRTHPPAHRSSVTN